MLEKDEKIATRVAYGEALLKLGGRYKNIVVIDADLCSSIKTDLFAKHFKERHFNVGVAEANMTGVAAGFALRGKISFTNTFAVFAAGRDFDQIRVSVCYPNLNVKVIGSHAGIFAGEDGPTHHAIEDIALMRALPNMKVFCPADAVETAQVTEALVKDFGPAYLRLGRNPVPVIYDKKYKFEIGKGDVLQDGKDICIFAAGTTVSTSLDAAAALTGKEGLSVRVVNMCSIKPIDENLIVKCAKECGTLFSVEDHNVIGGLGSAISEVLTSKCPARLHRIGIKDAFAESGKAADLYKKYKLDGKGICEQVLKVL